MKRTLASFLAALALLASLPGAAQVVTDATKTGIPNGTPSAITASTGTGSTMVLDTAPTISSPTLNTPTLVAPALGTPTSGVATNLTGTAASLTAGTATHVVTNANLTGPITSSGNATAIAAQTGTGTTIVVQTAPTLSTPTLTIPILSTQTWANLPAAAAGNTGAFTIASDLGSSSTIVMSTGARWRPLSGLTVLNSMPSVTTGIANTELIVCQTLLPTNSWQTGDSIVVWLDETKSGTTDNGLVSVRVGTGGTTSDTAITGLSAFQYIGAAGVLSYGAFEIRLISATSAQKVGGNASNSSSIATNSATTEAVATTITSAASNPLYVSVGIKSSSTNNTVGASVCRIELHTP